MVKGKGSPGKGGGLRAKMTIWYAPRNRKLMNMDI